MIEIKKRIGLLHALYLCSATLLIFSCQPKGNNESKNTKEDNPLEKKIDSVLAGMSLHEKIGQTAQRGKSSRAKELPSELKEAVRKGEIGSFLNIMSKDDAKELQRIAMEESPSKIPLIFARDVIHGFKTIFPIPLAQAASFNPELVKKGSRIAAIEASTSGIRWTFAPMLDISRDPRWGAGYGAAEGGRDYNTANINDNLLHNVYLKPFKEAVDAGAATFMSGFNEINGVPASGNNYILKDILRDQWGFDGFVVSDWNSITEMINHGFVEDEGKKYTAY